MASSDRQKIEVGGVFRTRAVGASTRGWHYKVIEIISQTLYRIEIIRVSKKSSEPKLYLGRTLLVTPLQHEASIIDNKEPKIYWLNVDCTDYIPPKPQPKRRLSRLELIEP